ncbi:MAG: response regulator [Planctomycetaceae bacterium]|nr:response regulator [Planctomycetaceae bacterium]MBV8608641.1 response regulator [Singulisphaera sp.]MBV8230134.1 response regulator [Planctomycetaceae bacterium]MBV8265226.1 response regulator [Planctomycetaceae bacterium]MBV8317767.1 response regulator [Planctomycetaceae bacterium]
MTLDRPYSILITDDDVVTRETLRDIFEPVGFRTLLAESGEEAIDIVKDQDVHLALMDMHLPRLSGLETMTLVRQIKGLLPMILISAEQDDNLLRQALSAHAFCVLAKPVSKNVIIYVVTKALEKFY